MLENTEHDEISNVYFGKPHVVILGAGASRAAYPKGDKNGAAFPLMNDLIPVLGLSDLCEANGILWKDRNFEDIYSSLSDDKKYDAMRSEVEQRVYDYFSAIEPFDGPNLYDHLVLSLREKDLIATFNWDPLLYMSLQRNHARAKMPQAVFLHGNVYVGFCLEHKKMGWNKQNCSVCKKPFAKSNLLYPIKKKDYINDPFIKPAWEYLATCLKNAYILTIFGYGAPASDVEAIQLMKEAWGDKEKRVLEEIEIIDVKGSGELEAAWNAFIHTHHFRTCSSFYDSFLANHPRRSCEAMWECLMQCNPYPDRTIPKDADFDDLWKWFEPLVLAEK